jgi:polyisoprenyl-teichoic acid--peptidoglycan teichoic acid transferase
MSSSDTSVPQPDETKRSLYDYEPEQHETTSPHWYNKTVDTGQPTATNQPGNTPPPAPVYRSRRYYQQAAAKNNWLWVIVAVMLLGLTLVFTMGIIFVLQTGDDASDESVMVATTVPNNNNSTAGNNAGGQPSANQAEENTADNDSSAEEQQPPADTDDPSRDNPAPSTDLQGEDGSEPITNDPPGSTELNIRPWDGEERFTILLMGIDARPEQGANGLYRTDTMMIVSFDPVDDSIGMMSIPRDTYVNIPGYTNLQRVNTAYLLGNNQRPGFGPTLAMQTVQYNFGIRIHDYMLVDFNAFIKIIDRVGGVSVFVEKEINDRTYPDMNFGYDPFYISEGWHHLDGETALKYARSRHTTDDVDRGRRQQQLILALRDQVVTLDMIDELITNALPIWNDINEGIESGLGLDQLLELALFAVEVPEENINNAVVNWECCLQSYTTPTGASVLIPERYSLGLLMVEIFGEGYNQ